MSCGLLGSWSWWTHPLATQHGDDLLLGFSAPNGDAGVAAIRDGAIRTTAILPTPYSKDDHNAPAVVVLGDGNLLAAYTGHMDDSVVRYRVAASVDGLASSTERTLTTNADATYVQLFVSGSRVCLVTRPAATGRAWGLFVSRDHGATWTAQRLIVNLGVNAQMYLLAREVGGMLRCFCMKHATTSGNTIRLLTVDPDAPGATPSFGSLPAIYTAPSGHTIRLLDVADDATAYLYADTVAGVTTYYAAHLAGCDPANPANWAHTSLGPAGAFFYASSQYIGGAVFDRMDPANRTYLIAREGCWSRTLERAGDVLHTIAGGGLVIRPISPPWDSALSAIWQVGTYSSYTNHTLAVRYA